MTKAQKAEQEAAREELRKSLKPGSTVYCGLKSVSRSGMSREIALYVVVDGAIRWITGYAAKALGRRVGKKDGIVIGGCGMDMGFALVYELSHALYPKGFGCVGDGGDRGRRCPSNEHSNGDRDYTVHGSPKVCGGSQTECHCVKAEHWHGECTATENTCRIHHWHNSGSYALRHEWI